MDHAESVVERMMDTKVWGTGICGAQISAGTNYAKKGDVLNRCNDLARVLSRVKDGNEKVVKIGDYHITDAKKIRGGAWIEASRAVRTDDLLLTGRKGIVAASVSAKDVVVAAHYSGLFAKNQVHHANQAARIAVRQAINDIL